MFGSALRFFRALWIRRDAILELARRDLQAQNQRTYLGVVWAYVQPLVYVVVVVIVFSIGLRSNPGLDVPFVVYLIAGQIVWQFFQHLTSEMTRVVRSNSYLVMRGDFELSTLPVAKLLSATPPHAGLTVVAVLVCWLKGLPPTVYLLQLVYYTVALYLLLLGIGWMTSAASLFIDDVANVVNVIVTFGFWLTPIFWNLSMVPDRLRWIFQLNPMFYIVNGYRDSLFYHVAFWERPFVTAYFWAVTVVVLLVGATVFRRLRPHFAEVL